MQENQGDDDIDAGEVSGSTLLVLSLLGRTCNLLEVKKICICPSPVSQSSGTTSEILPCRHLLCNSPVLRLLPNFGWHFWEECVRRCPAHKAKAGKEGSACEGCCQSGGTPSTAPATEAWGVSEAAHEAVSARPIKVSRSGSRQGVCFLVFHACLDCVRGLSSLTCVAGRLLQTSRWITHSM